jgi:hypothetical protein
MKTKNLFLLAIAMIMTFATAEANNNMSSLTKTELEYRVHPRFGKIARGKANRVKRQLIKREMKRRWLRPRHRGITIVL